MLDGTEAQLRSRRDLGNIREQPVGVGAIDAANFFDGVQVRQAPSIEDQIVSPPNLLDLIERKANGLVDGHEQIQQQKRNHAGVNYGPGQDHQEARIPDVPPERGLELAVLA